MRRFVCVGLAIAFLALLVGSASAWEFKMKGETEWRYRYWTRTGNNDIFGPMDDRVYLGINHLQTFPTAATTNRGVASFGTAATFGVLAGQNRFGSDMQKTDYRMTLFPKIVVNKAIEVSASVNLTSLGIWSDGQPLDSSGNTNLGYVNSLYVPIQDRPVAVDVPNTYMTLQWLKVGMKTPMMDFSFGYKTSSIGIGLWKHSCNRASSSFSVSAKYGPFKIGFSPYFGREQSSWSAGTSRIEGNGAAERQEDRRDYFKAVMGEVEYNSGELSVHLVSDSYHQPNYHTPTARGASISSTARPNEDILRYRIALAVKYNNGRFFFNGEADWFNRWRSGRGTADPSTLGGSPVRQRVGRDNDAWLYGAETGLYGGPAKMTVNYVRATGDDPSTRHTTEDAADSEQGLSACYMKDWGYLIYYMYGTGDGWDAAGYGQPTNFHHVGGRIDYALAANLNFFGVYAYAWRDQPNAYRLGGDYRLGAQSWTNDDIRLSQTGTFRGQAVPDSARDIGWEIDLGFNWKLLENLTWNNTFAYWQPGTWWSFAYPNTAYMYRIGTTPNSNSMTTAAGAALATFGSGHAIDPLFAVETNLLIQF